jgi:thiol-disulfide isomerase/thioredoxin
MNTIIRNALIVLGFVGFAALAPAGEDKEVKLTPVKWQGYLDEVASHKKAKLVIVDAWATWCGPCMKNFPHLVEMHEKYADKGLVAVSLSLDDADNAKKVTAATAFLKDKHATFTNLILNERTDDAFEKLNIGAIPAVFLYTPDGKELKRFTLDDVDKLFTYEQVEAYVKDYLAGKSPK